MTYTNKETGARHGGSPWRGAGVAVLGLTLALGACDTESLVQLPDPDLITLPVVEDTANIEALRNGAVSEFADALTGPAANNNTPGLIGISATLTDEAWYASTFPSMKAVDSRDILDTNGEVQEVYSDLHRARNLAAEVAQMYAENRPNSPDRPMLVNIVGYSYLLFAENWCSGVPFSRAPLGQPLEYAAGISKTQMLNEAIARFDEVIGLADSDSPELNLARIGKARALQNLGQFDEAAAAVADVPTDFVYLVTYSDNTAGQNNGVYYNFNSARRTSVASAEGTNGLVFFPRGATPDGPNTFDPRVVADSSGFGSGTQFPHYAQAVYTDFGSDVVLASGVEARLIEAEAQLDQGADQNAFDILNALRADLGLADLEPSGVEATDVLTLYEERAFWLWMTAHRQGDLRRLVAIYGMDPENVYPVGRTIFGEPYGTDVVFPVPEEEQNNPLFEGCINFDA